MLFRFSLVIILFSFSNALSLTKKNLVFDGGVKLTVEVAKSQKDRSQGLMYRKELKKNHGMLFEFPKIDYMSFWMKNTYIPLSIGFFDKDRRLLQVIDMKPAQGPVRESKLKNYRSQSKGKYALEVNIGWFKRHKIKTGSRFQMK